MIEAGAPSAPSMEYLESLSNEELDRIEDEVLLANEINSNWRIRASSGRFVTFIFGAIIWGLLSGLGLFFLNKMKQKDLAGLLSMGWIFIALFLAVVISHIIWQSLGIRLRQIIRLGLHYWPVSISLIGYILVFFGVGKNLNSIH